MGPSRRELLRVIERERMRHRDEIAVLLDRIAALTGNPWTLPPRPVERIGLSEDEQRIRDEEFALEEL